MRRVSHPIAYSAHGVSHMVDFEQATGDLSEPRVLSEVVLGTFESP